MDTTVQNTKKVRGPNGGRRKGAGRPKGKISQKTLDKIIVKKNYEQRIMAASDALINAQIHIATGQTFLYKIEKELIIGPKGGKSYRSKKPVIVTAQWEIESYLEGLIAEGDMHDDNDPGATYYYLTAKEPNNEALKDLQNRLHGKPKESLDMNVNVKFSLKGLAERREQLKAKATVIDVTKSTEE